MRIHERKGRLFLLPVIAAIVALLLLLRPGQLSACEPLDPIPVVVGATHFSIPAVLLPTLKPEDGIEIRSESQSLTGKEVSSKSGTPLRWWYCASETGDPFDVKGFTLDGKWIADAVEHGELNFEHLPFVGNVIVSEGQVLPQGSQDASAVPFFSSTFQVVCGESYVLPKTNEHEILGTQCLVNTVNVSNDAKIRLTFWIYESSGFPTRNAPDTWPALAREVEQLIQAMTVPKS